MINLKLLRITHIAFHFRHILTRSKIHSKTEKALLLPEIAKSSTEYQHLVSMWGQCQSQISLKYFEIIQSFNGALHMNSHSQLILIYPPRKLHCARMKM